mgnify:CR=1 FL=1
MKKPIAVALCILSFAYCVEAQFPKGSIFIATTTELNGGVYNNLLTGTGNSLGWSFISSYSKSGSSTSDKIKERAFNLSPMVGYMFMDNLVTGLNLTIWCYSEKDSDYTDKYSSFTVGPFVRYYILSTELGGFRIMPYAEAKIIFGNLVEKYSYTGTDEKYTNGLTIWGINGGASAMISDCFSLDLIFGFKKYVTNYKEDDYKDICNVFGFGLGLTVIISK